MQQLTQAIAQDFAPMSPRDLLSHLSQTNVDGCLHVFQGNISFYFHLQGGQLLYATHTLEPFERLDRYLRRLSHTVTTLGREIRAQVRVQFEQDEDIPRNTTLAPPLADYQAIGWLLEKGYVTGEYGAWLLQQLSQEVVENYLLLKGDLQHLFLPSGLPQIYGWRSPIPVILETCEQRLQQWRCFLPQISSSYQRPYFFGGTQARQKLSPEQQQRLGSMLKGFNFRQLAALLNQDELILAQRLYPLVRGGSILVREPQTPFDRLPRFTSPPQGPLTCPAPIALELGESILQSRGGMDRRVHKIVCIDDSPIVLAEIDRFLDSDRLAVTTVDDSLKALRTVIRLEPDLILMDVSMPNLDGYKLCGLLRKHPRFRDTPIIMVTGNKGVINRAKAKLSGATDYMTKPFNQNDLTQMVFRYLS
jgi:twitching motility two-component system response regulator PilG